MGEAAEDILDGTVCEGCGGVLRRHHQRRGPARLSTALRVVRAAPQAQEAQASEAIHGPQTPAALTRRRRGACRDRPTF